MIMIKNLGQVVFTQGVQQFINENVSAGFRVLYKLFDHQCGRWGDVSNDDWTANDAAAEYLNRGKAGRVLSSYSVFGRRVWIITEGDASNRVTTILFPEEY